MSMGLRKGPILPISQTNHPHKSPVNFREVQLSSVGSDDCRQGLRKAIDATFARRQTNLPPLPEALTEAFANDPTKQVQWAAFLRRNGLTGVPERFSEVVAVLRKFFEPVLRLR